MFDRGESEESRLTFLVYLNHVKAGGETVFHQFTDSGFKVDFKVHPEQGKALLFDHLRFHEGAEVKEGCKYLLRSDVLYRPPLVG